jgi:N-alpha-acetyltransferase 50
MKYLPFRFSSRTFSERLGYSQIRSFSHFFPPLYSFIGSIACIIDLAWYLYIQLRKINMASFPIQYNESFYHDIGKRRNDDLNKFAYWNGYVVGAICTRVEPVVPGDTMSRTTSGKRLYIMTLAVLAAYRGRGIGSQLLTSVLHHVDTHMPEVTEIALHVQISNQGAIKFYTERFGFTHGDLVENYYRRIDPPHCYWLYKVLEPHVSSTTNNNNETSSS